MAKRPSTLLIIRKMQIKTTIEILPHMSEWLSSKIPQGTHVDEDVEKREPLYTVGGNVN